MDELNGKEHKTNQDEIEQKELDEKATRAVAKCAEDLILAIEVDDLFKDYKLSQNMNDTLSDFSSFSNTMGYFSIYNVLDIGHYIDAAVKEKEAIYKHLYKLELLQEHLNKINSKIVQSYEFLAKDDLRLNRYIDRAAITYRGLKRQEKRYYSCKNKTHLFPGEEEFTKKMENLKKQHQVGIKP